MDSSFTIKPSPGVAQNRAPRDPVPVREAVETELVGTKTVTPSGDSGAKDEGRKDEAARDGDHGHDHAPHDLVADPESRDVIYRERDIRALDRQLPDQALLRQRAYHRLTPTQFEAVPSD